MPFIRYDTGDSAELVALPNATNGYRLTVRGITPKHGTEYLMGRSGTLIAIKGIISNLQGTAYGIREYQFFQDTPGKAVVRLVALSGAVTDFSNYRDFSIANLPVNCTWSSRSSITLQPRRAANENSSINASTWRARWPICKELERRCRIPKSRRLHVAGRHNGAVCAFAAGNIGRRTSDSQHRLFRIGNVAEARTCRTFEVFRHVALAERANEPGDGTIRVDGNNHPAAPRKVSADRSCETNEVGAVGTVNQMRARYERFCPARPEHETVGAL